MGQKRLSFRLEKKWKLGEGGFITLYHAWNCGCKSPVLHLPRKSMNLYETFILLAHDSAFLCQTKTDCSYALVLESASIQLESSWRAPHCHEQWMIFETDVFVTQIICICWHWFHLSWYTCTVFTSVFYSRSWFYFVVISCHTVCVGILYVSILFSLQLNFKLRMLCTFAKF